MSFLPTYRLGKTKQYTYSILAVLLVALLCFLLSAYIDYRVVAFILLVTVSLIAVSFDIRPVLVAAILSALIWDVFFIPPTFTLVVSNTEDAVLLAMYFIIAMINAVLTTRLRKMEELARQREERTKELRLYNTLLNSLSHELRTPIATIIGATDNLLENDARLSVSNRVVLLTEVSAAALRLNQQVENLLNMSRLESGYLQPSKDWCDIEELVHSIKRKFDDAKPGHSIQVTVQPELPLFLTDKTLLEQVLYNLVNNAVVHTPPGTSIHIQAGSQNGTLELTVEDTGTGFPEAEIGLVFEKFYRLKNTTATGTGLGLSIVKGFTEALGGTVSLENKEAGGARITVRIPAITSPSTMAHE